MRRRMVFQLNDNANRRAHMQLKDVEPGNPDGRTAGSVIDRSMELFDDRLLEQRTHVDRMFAKLMLVQWMAAITMAALYSPGASAGAHQQIDGSLTLALLGGAALSVMPMLMVRLSPGSRASRQAIAVCQLLFSSLFIHLSGGRMETHLHVFVSLAWLGFYLDWRVLVTATAVVAADHLLRGLFVPASAYMMVQASQWRLLAQVLWAVFEDVIL